VDIARHKPTREATKARERKLGPVNVTAPALAWSARPDGSAEFFKRLYPGLRCVPSSTAPTRPTAGCFRSSMDVSN
jgi:hypothetical protein